MTAKNNTNSILINAELERIEADLELAREDVALLERLKSATDRVARLEAQHGKATTARTKVLAVEAKANEERRFAGISDVRVTVHPKTTDENVIRTSWTITYTRPAWDGRVNQPMENSVESFGALPPEILDYIIEKRPDLIPAKIMDLAPDSPTDAFRRYFVSVRRGYVAA